MTLHWLKNKLPNTFKRSLSRSLQNAWQSPLYRLPRNSVLKGDLRQIVFICQGNVCRSAFAENWLRSRLPENTLKIESCGLSVGRSTPPPAQALKVSEDLGIDLSSHLSKGYESCDLENADLIIAMVYNHLNRVNSIHPKYRDKALLLRNFAPFPDNLVCNIHDPYGLDHSEFQRCFHLIQISLQGLIKHFGLPTKHD